MKSDKLLQDAFNMEVKKIDEEEAYVIAEIEEDTKVLEGELQTADGVEKAVDAFQKEVQKNTMIDYRSSRRNIKKLLSKSEVILNGAMMLATGSDHPRAYEVAASTLKVISEMQKDLMKMNKDMKPTEDNNVGGGNAVGGSFVGTTQELMKLIRESSET